MKKRGFITAVVCASPTPHKPKRVKRWPALAALTSAMCAIQPTYALGLGTAVTNSHIGQPITIRIPLQTEPNDDIGTDCIRLEGPRDDAQDDMHWVRGARMRIAYPNDQATLIITSSQAINSPYVMLAVRMDCKNVRLRREYTLLLNPPNSVERLETTAESTSPAALPASVGVKDSPAPTATAAIKPSKKTSNSSSQQSVKTTRNRSLALTTKPLPSAEAPRLRISADPSSALQLSTSIGQRTELSEAQRARLRNEMQLIAKLDEKIATQLELSEKLRQLEALQQHLQSAVSAMEDRLQAQAAETQPSAALSAPPAPPAPPTKATPAVPKSHEEIEHFAIWPTAIALSVAICGLWALWQKNRARARLRRAAARAKSHKGRKRISDIEDDFDDAPLSALDIWPERDQKPSYSVPRPRNVSAGDLPTLSGLANHSATPDHIVTDLEEHHSAVELADIMLSFGRPQGAADTLTNYIRNNPKEAVQPWLKLLEVYKNAEMREEFDQLSGQLQKTFNIKATSWEGFEAPTAINESLEQLPHLSTQLCALWGTPECQSWLYGLLRDNREGMRQGLPLPIVNEILLLLGILEVQLGAYIPGEQIVDRPDTANTTTQAALKNPVPDTTADALGPPSLQLVHSSNKPRKTKAEVNPLGELDIDFNKTDFSLKTADLTRTIFIDLDELPEPAKPSTHAK